MVKYPSLSYYVGNMTGRGWDKMMVDGHELNDDQKKKLLKFMINHVELYDINTLEKMKKYFDENKYYVKFTSENEMAFASNDGLPYLVIKL